MYQLLTMALIALHQHQYLGRNWRESFRLASWMVPPFHYHHYHANNK